MKAILKKLYGNKLKTTKLRKVNLGLKQDYEQKRQEFLEINDKVNDIFLRLKDLKIEFQDLDNEWSNLFREQNELADTIIFELSELGLDISEMFDQQNETTNIYYIEGEWDDASLKYVRS